MTQDFLMVDLIAKKRDGGELTAPEIKFWLSGMLDGLIPDYQTSAMLMAIYFRGLSEQETYRLTEATLASGEQLDLSALSGIKVDKHSTGGVGDKTSLIAMPLAASAGLTVVKMSGRSLGKTGGTADKLESVPGFKLDLPPAQIAKQAAELGLVLISQSGNLTPADKRLYALRDLTATVDSLPLIAASVMSKKLAAGAEVIVLDVKFGSGAFMADAESAVKLARLMVKIGGNAGRRVSAVVSAMSAPLGRAVGNAVEVWEAAEALCGRGAADITGLSLALTAELLYLAGAAESRRAGFWQAKAALDSGQGYNTLLQFLQAQGGDVSALARGDFLTARRRIPIYAEKSGYLAAAQADRIAAAVQRLGAGRRRLEDEIDRQVGVIFAAQPGDKLTAGQTIAEVLANDRAAGEQAAVEILAACRIDEAEPQLPPLIYGVVTAERFIPWAELRGDYQI